MSRYGNRRRGMRRHQGNQWMHDEYTKYRSDEGGGGSRRWDLSPSYREHFGHQVMSADRTYGQDDVSPTRYQYYSGREDYPGPSSAQGFGRGYEGERRNTYSDWNNRDRSYNNENYRTDWQDMKEYGYGSGRSDMPIRRTWDARDDESYNWGEHAGNDWTSSGQHRGKGPKGYKRLDERIREEVNDILCDDDHLDASDIVVTVNDGEVSLSGTVPDRRSKRRAEDLVEEISGVTNVENRIRIGRVEPEQPISKDSRQIANGRKAFQKS